MPRFTVHDSHICRKSDQQRTLAGHALRGRGRVHPVMAADGNTYDRSSIEDWFSRGKKTSPLTGAPLAHLGLTPNNLVRSMVSEYRDAASRAS